MYDNVQRCLKICYIETDTHSNMGTWGQNGLYSKVALAQKHYILLIATFFCLNDSAIHKTIWPEKNLDTRQKKNYLQPCPLVSQNQGDSANITLEWDSTLLGTELSCTERTCQSH